MSIDASTLFSAVVAALCAFGGSWLAFSTRLAKVEQKVDSLCRSVNKHNQVIERTYKLEERVDSALHSLDEVKEDIDRYHRG